MRIDFTWDKDACVWMAECERVGLVLEAESWEALFEKTKAALPEQLRLNGLSAKKKFVIHTADRQVAMYNG